MAITYTDAVKVARMNAVITAAGAAAVLEIGTTGMASILATFALANPIGSSAGAGVMTLDFDPDISDTSADNSGTAAEARIRTASDGTDIITGMTVGTSGADVVLDSVSITAGQTVTITAGTITHA
ncbi:MAG: hypothetical protein WAO76_00520 [Georgfuchsia sp.]